MRLENPALSVSLPELGVLKLGTGNAVADLLGGTNPSEDLRRMAAHRVPSTTNLDLIDCEGIQAPFVGFGYDAAVLNDYVALKDGARDPRLRKVVDGLPDYLAAAFGMSVPKQLSRRREVEVGQENLAVGRRTAHSDASWTAIVARRAGVRTGAMSRAQVWKRCHPAREAFTTGL